MKKIIITILCMILTVNAFALKLPNGDNVKAGDVVMDGDSIVEVKLKEDSKITTPLNGQQLIADTYQSVKFYKSGALQYFYLKSNTYNNSYQTIKLMEQEVKISGGIIFYESGALKRMSLQSNSSFKMNIEGISAEINGYTNEFYDSGNPNEFKLYSGSLKKAIEIEKNGSKIYIENSFTLYENGKLKSSHLHKGTTVKTEIGELFAGKGEITFWEDGSIKSFTNDDTIIETIAGMKVSIPSGTRMSIYKSGKIRSFYVTNEIQFKLGANTYTTIKGDTNFPFIISEDGNILSAPAIKWDNNKDGNILGEKIAVESFDSKFEPCIIYDLYTGYKYLVYNRKILASFSEQPFLYQTHDAYLYYQPGDTGENIWMVYFDSKGIPSTYCVYDKITGERNTEKKQFVKKK